MHPRKARIRPTSMSTSEVGGRNKEFPSNIISVPSPLLPNNFSPLSDVHNEAKLNSSSQMGNSPTRRSSKRENREENTEANRKMIIKNPTTSTAALTATSTYASSRRVSSAYTSCESKDTFPSSTLGLRKNDNSTSFTKCASTLANEIDNIVNPNLKIKESILTLRKPSTS